MFFFSEITHLKKLVYIFQKIQIIKTFFYFLQKTYFSFIFYQLTAVYILINHLTISNYLINFVQKVSKFFV